MFGVIRESTTSNTTQPTPNASGSIAVDPNLSHSQSSAPAPSVPTIPEDSPTQNLTSRSLRTLASRLITMVEKDVDLPLPPPDPSQPQPPQPPRKWPISVLFDFEAGKHWVSAAQRSAHGSLEQEMEYYDLLDLDASGEPDLDYDIDDCIDSIFSN